MTIVLQPDLMSSLVDYSKSFLEKPMPSVIEVENLIFEYPNKRALNGISFSIIAGSVTALVGPNGAGKSTLLRCLAALELPLSGNIKICGFSSETHPRDCHRNIGFLSDFYGLYERLSVYQCLRYFALSRGINSFDIKERVTETAKDLEIADLLEKKPIHLSRGQRQRLAIAQAIIHKPAILLLDEPAAGLDPEARHSLSTLIRTLREHGSTIMVSSHILTELEDYSDCMLTIQAGRILAHEKLGDRATPNTMIRIKLSGDVSAGYAAVAAYPGVLELSRKGEDLIFRFSSEASLQNQMLKVLIGQNIPICYFAPESESIESRYLAQLAQPRRGISL